MTGRLERCPRCGARLSAPYLYWCDGDGDFDLDERAQRCPNCRYEHVWANVDDPDYDRSAWPWRR